MPAATTLLACESERIKRAAKMLLGGATLLGPPCPYCKGVRVLKNGDALCVNCGQEPEARDISPQGASGTDGEHPSPTAICDTMHDNPQQTQWLERLEEKLVSLSRELEVETDRQKEMDILNSIDAILSIIKKTSARHTTGMKTGKTRSDGIVDCK